MKTLRFPDEHGTRLLLAVPAFAFVIALTTALPMRPGQAKELLSTPEGAILLTVSGNISRTNHHQVAQFDLAMLEALPTTTFDTSSPWSEGIEQYKGVRLNTLLEAVGAGSHRFDAIALDNYEVLFSDVDLERYPVLLAYQEAERYLTVRTLGPLRIMFPFDEFPELLTQSNMTISVWQLTEIKVH